MPLDRRPIHDTAASTISLARAQLMGIDRSQLETKIQTATLVMLLEALIGTGEGPAHEDIRQAGRKTVMGHFARSDELIRARDDDDRRANG